MENPDSTLIDVQEYSNNPEIDRRVNYLLAGGVGIAGTFLLNDSEAFAADGNGSTGMSGGEGGGNDATSEDGGDGTKGGDSDSGGDGSPSKNSIDEKSTPDGIDGTKSPDAADGKGGSGRDSIIQKSGQSNQDDVESSKSTIVKPADKDSVSEPIANSVAETPNTATQPLIKEQNGTETNSAPNKITPKSVAKSDNSKQVEPVEPTDATENVVNDPTATTIDSIPHFTVKPGVELVPGSATAAQTETRDTDGIDAMGVAVILVSAIGLGARGLWLKNHPRTHHSDQEASS